MSIDVGQRLREVNPPYRIWEVVRVIRPPTGRRHAQLRLAANHRTTRILSCTDLESGRSFRPVARENVF